MIPVKLTQDIQAGIADIREGIANRAVWRLLAGNDIKRRYRRSRLGQFWLTLSLAITIGGMATVWSLLFKMNLTEYLPHVAVYFVLWTFLTASLNESCNALVEGEGIIRNVSLPRSIFVLRVVWRNVIVAAHNAVIVLIVFLAVGQPVKPTLVLAIPGFMLLAAVLAATGLALSIVSARFRDMPQMVASFLQIAFFLSPVMFKPEQLAGNALGEALLWGNLLAALLEVAGAPLLGQVPTAWAYGVALVAFAASLAAAAFCTGRFGKKVIYWL